MRLYRVGIVILSFVAGASLFANTNRCYAQEVLRPLTFPPSVAPQPLERLASSPALSAPVEYLLDRRLKPLGTTTVPLHLHLRPGIARVIVSDGFERRVAECYLSCKLALPVGTYLLKVDQRDAFRRGKSYRHATPTFLSVEPADPTTSSFGLALGIAGAVVATTGLVIATYGHLLPGPDLLWGGLIGTAAGGAMMAGGFTLYAYNHQPEFMAEPLVSAPQIRSARIEFSPHWDGASMTAGVTF